MGLCPFTDHKAQHEYSMSASYTHGKGIAVVTNTGVGWMYVHLVAAIVYVVWSPCR